MTALNHLSTTYVLCSKAFTVCFIPLYTVLAQRAKSLESGTGVCDKVGIAVRELSGRFFDPLGPS